MTASADGGNANNARKRKSPGPKPPEVVAKAVATRTELRRQKAAEAAEAKRFEFEKSTHYTMEWVPVYKTFTDPSYQRDPTRGRQIAENLDPDLFGIITLSRRDKDSLGPQDQEYAIVDGGNRVAAYRYLGWETQLVHAEVFTGLTIEQEARLFAEMNLKRVKPLPIQTFLAQVRAGDPTAVAIHDAVTSAGAHMPRSMSAGPGAIRFASQIMQVERNSDVQTIHMTLLLMMKAWGNDPLGLNGQCFQAIAYIVHHFGRTIDLGRLADKLSALNPKELVSEARRLGTLGGKRSLYITIARIIVAEYNKNMRNNRLPDLPLSGWKRGTLRPGMESWLPKGTQQPNRRTPHWEIGGKVPTDEELATLNEVDISEQVDRTR